MDFILDSIQYPWGTIFIYMDFILDSIQYPCGTIYGQNLQIYLTENISP